MSPLQIVEAIPIIKRAVINTTVPAASSSKIARIKLFVVLCSYQATSPSGRRETTKSQPTGLLPWCGCNEIRIVRVVTPNLLCGA
jgi:hypothetical protein